MKISIEDIAQKTGVSKGTVSRVMNNKPHVNVKTREKVLKAVQQMQYTSSRKQNEISRTIGVVIDRFASRSPYQSEIFFSILAVATEMGYDVKPILSTDITRNLDSVTEFIHRKNVSAIIAFGHFSDNETFRVIRENKIPHVIINNYDGEPTNGLFSIVSNADTAVAKAFIHLKQLGHDSVALLRPEKENVSDYSKNVIENVTRCARDMGITVTTYKVNPSKEEAEMYAYRMLRTEGFDGTCVFSTYHGIAIGFINACHGLGVRIPNDYSLISVGSRIHFENFFPRIATISQDYEKIAGTALWNIDLIFSGVEQREVNSIPSEYIMQPSCGVPSRED